MTPDLDQIVHAFRTPLQLNAKRGERILILTDTKMDPLLWKGLASAANELGMEPMVAIMNPRVTHSTNPPQTFCDAALNAGTDLTIYLTSTALAHSTLTDALIDRGKRFILMEELTAEMLAPGGPGAADYPAMNVYGTKLAEIFTAGETIRVTCPNGTDLTASIKGRPGRSIAGLPLAMKPGGGGGCAFPDGETHVCPVEGTGNGTIVFDMTAHTVGRLKEPMRLVIQDGWVTAIEGGREAQIWRELLEKHADPNNYNCPAEIAIGLNPNVTPLGIMRTDKKKYGASHIGIGDTIALGGTCHARLRLEGVISEPEISVDGKLLTRGGKILLNEQRV
jgi:leucyl aminopeptidase (aminopeptidase T)